MSQEPAELYNGLGRLTVQNGGTAWVEDDHWTAILDGIGELKHSLGDTDACPGTSALPPRTSRVSGVELLLGANNSTTREELLAAIPQRAVVDRLISQFLRFVDVAPMILHIPTFLEEYEQFWTQPEQTSVLWTGQLYAIMCLAALHQQFGLEVEASHGNCEATCLAQSYRTRISQCLVLGPYTTPAPYVIETLLLYMHVEYLQSKDSETGLWILLGITLRLALRMGYHRDPAHYSGISPLQGEMRRRIWCVLGTMDAGAAAQFGLPRMLNMSQSTITEPRNLLDDDLHKDILELPPARPETTQTPVQYFVAKSRLISISGRISDLGKSQPAARYEAIISFDQLLNKAYDGIPRHLTMRPISASLLDDSSVIIQRVYLALTFYKAKCLLHRRYLISAKPNDECLGHSSTACIDAALEMLRIQQTLDEETVPGGRLYNDRGRVTSQMKSDFLLATTILCIYLDHNIARESLGEARNAALESHMVETVRGALYDAYQSWLRCSNASYEAEQAIRALDVVLHETQVGSRAEAVYGESELQATTGVQGQSNERNAGGIPQTSFTHLPAMTLREADNDSFFQLDHCESEKADRWMFDLHKNAQVPDTLHTNSTLFDWMFPGNSDWSADLD